MGEIVVSVPVGTLCLALPIFLPGTDGLVLTIADGERDGGVFGEEPILLPRPGCGRNPVVPEGGDKTMQFTGVLEGELKDSLRFFEPSPVSAWSIRRRRSISERTEGKEKRKPKELETHRRLVDRLTDSLVTGSG